MRRVQPRQHHFDDPRHQHLSNYFQNAITSGRLGNGQRENPHTNLFKAAVQTFPTVAMLIQLIWSSIVVLAGYFISRDLVENNRDDTLNNVFWQSRINVSPSVTSGVGWALFVLIGFYIKAANGRYIDAQHGIYKAGNYLQRLVRVVRQCFPEGSWHPGDRDRIIAHLMAYPLALKMTLRGERDIDLLKTVLHPRDAEDVIAARSMHFHCMRVVKSYLIVADNMNAEFPECNTVKKCQMGMLTRMAVAVMADAVDETTISVFRISQFRPSIAYINHLKIFLLIWMMFVPLTIIATSGWFTILWSLLITYVVAMLALLAECLDHPFGYDEQDIKLNGMCAHIAHNVLVTGYATKLEYSDVIDEEHETPTWLEDELTKENQEPLGKKFGPGAKPVSTFAATGRFRKGVYFSLLLLILWTTFIVLLTWGLRDDPAGVGTKWWQIYVPVTGQTSSYLSLALSTLLSFWLTDAYNRYWKSVQLWQTTFHPQLVQYSYHITACAKPGHWHNRDRERILSHLVALPYVLSMQLRGTPEDISMLEGILSPKDLTALSEAPNRPSRIFDLIYGYLRKADLMHKALSIEPNNFPKLEDLVIECESVQKFTISPAFTFHLVIMAAIWLMTLPLTLVGTAGWVSYAFIVPIGYSYIKLLSVGRELADPYGDDADDLPLYQFCDKMKESIITTYKETAYPSNARHYVRASSKYNRASLTPIPQPQDSFDPNRHYHDVTAFGVLHRALRKIPSVPILALVASLLWGIAAVCMSYYLGRQWPNAKRFGRGCVRWCSPVDVPSITLGNVGYALFLILAFRASDALSRYDDGTSCFTELQMMLRTMAVEACQYIVDGTFHEGDKERIVAHIAQIPLCFGDTLLGDEKTQLSNGGFLSSEDRELFNKSEDPLAYLIKTVEAYILTPDIKDVGADGIELGVKKPPIKNQLTFTGSMRMGRVRSLLAKVITVKAFPVVRSYKRHQRLFAAVWLMLLPFSMTALTGWLTILWVFVIAYSLLILEELAMKLVDPYGEDEGDLPIKQLCVNASAAILDGANSVGWGTDKLVRESLVDNDERLETVVVGPTVYNKHTVASTAPLPGVRETDEEGNENTRLLRLDDDGLVEFSSPREKRITASLYAHFIKSVPWDTLIIVTVWTTVAVITSYLTRNIGESKEQRWWRSYISISSQVAKYSSTGTLSLLGFYVTAAFGRYNTAAKFWGDELQSYCHQLTTTFLYLIPKDSMHKGDHRRVIGHIAALPLILKHELRHSRDIREIKGLLSSSDVARLLCAPSMSSACVDVIRAYFYRILGTPEVLTEKINPGLHFVPVWINIRSLESAVELVKRLNVFDIAPLFTTGLKTLLAIWFILLPFVLAEGTGWFTILWVFIISYGVLGMVNIAKELQHPFGNDINDLDLDQLADDIVVDVLQVYRLRKRGEYKVTSPSKMEGTIWKSPGLAEERTIFDEQEHMTTAKKIKQGILLALHPVPWWMLLGVAGWAALWVTIAYLVGTHFEVKGKGPNDCKFWWCSYIAIDSTVKEYYGFALFLLLGFRLNDSHGRYVRGISIFQDRVIGATRILSQRLFGSHGSTDWHPGGKEYVAGHLAAFSTCLMGALRNEDYEDRLRLLVSEEDTQKILRMRRRADYCADAVFNYFREGEQKMADKAKGVSIAMLEYMSLLIQWRKLAMTANDSQVVKTIPMPYGYVLHLRIFLLIWLGLLPLGIVEHNGWISILWVTIIGYGVIGVERWASELANPYGNDVSDVPLERLVDISNNVVKNEFDMYTNGIKPFIQTNRPPFPEITEDVKEMRPSELPKEIV